MLLHGPGVAVDDRGTGWIRLSALKEVIVQWLGSQSREGRLLFTVRCSLCLMVGTQPIQESFLDFPRVA